MKNKYSNPRSSGSNSQNILYGRHPIMAAIFNPDRQINTLFCTKENAEELQKACLEAKRNINLIKIIDKKEIEQMLPRDSVHQGFAAKVQPLPEYSIEEICDLAQEQDSCHILILDQVTDPQNIGAIIRSCVAFNTLALIVQDKNSPTENGTMAKASAGMIEHLPVCRVTNLSRAIEQLKDAGFWTIGMDGYAKSTIGELKKGGKNAIIMGSEGKGMRRLVEESCDITVRLPISEKVESLNVSTAAAIVLYEMSK